MKKRLLITALMLSSIVSLAGVTQMMQGVIARKNSAVAPSYFFEENFDDPGYERHEKALLRQRGE